MSRIKVDNLILMIETGNDLEKMPNSFIESKLTSVKILLDAYMGVSDEEKIILECFKDDLEEILRKRKENFPRLSG